MGRIVQITVGLLAVATLADAGESSSSRRLRAMGTELRVDVQAADRPASLAASEAAIAAILETERRLSTWNDASDLSRANRAPVGQPTRVGALLARDLQAALACAAGTGGAFNPGLGALVRAWGLRTGGRAPSGAEIDRARQDASLSQITLEDRRLVRLSEGFLFEEGGFGKGVGLDDAMAALEQTPATGAVLDLGGQIAVWGEALSEVVIADPRRRDAPALLLRVDRGSVATTGNSERGITVDGRRYGHVLDPRTGRPAPDFGSMTVWAADATRADCLATGLYVMGPEAAHCWAVARDDVAAITIEITEGGLDAVASPELEDRLTSLTDDLTLRFLEPPEDCRERVPHDGN
jgi:thiamine biosynthesis lipoprotein